jgi:outer membrane protein, heavy metal efflux system
MKIGHFLLLTAAFGGSGAIAAEPTPNLPPADVVARVLRANPSVEAARGQIRVEEANKDRLEAGSYEWNLRFGAHQRKVTPPIGQEERYNEWNAQLERPLRLPGKASADAELGAIGVAIAETAQGDALHEASRALLKYWFVWLKENAGAEQWAEQIALLEKQSRSIQRRQQLGDAARLEAVQAEAALAQAEAQLAQARARRNSAAEDLRRRFPGLPLSEPGSIAEPSAITGSESEWLDLIREHSHELGIARGAAQKAQLAAGRAGRELVPDPTVGVQMARERGGEENLLGAYIAITLPGGGRQAAASGALAEAGVATSREAAATQKVGAEAAALYHSATGALATWQSSRSAAERLGHAADMTARAYQLGEGSLNDLLTARRLANEARLAVRLAQLEALESRYRLLLDAHRLWDLD